jgi:hypothetical protein
MPDDKFAEDLDALMRRICPDQDGLLADKLAKVKSRLVELNRQNLVKINHSVMELLCAKPLILKGYDVEAECGITDLLVCDLLGRKGDGRAIVEIETGFIPPEHALDPGSYYEARVISKVARYSAYCEKFSLGTPPLSILPIPAFFEKPARLRDMGEINAAKALCDRYYRNPPIELAEIRQASLHSVFLIDVDRGHVRELDIETYLASHLRNRIEISHT